MTSVFSHELSQKNDNFAVKHTQTVSWFLLAFDHFMRLAVKRLIKVNWRPSTASEYIGNRCVVKTMQMGWNMETWILTKFLEAGLVFKNFASCRHATLSTDELPKKIFSNTLNIETRAGPYWWLFQLISRYKFRNQ